MPDWNTRLAVSYVDAEGNTVDITPIDNYTPTFSFTRNVIHSIEQTHVGVVHTPDNLTFSMTVQAIGDVAARLTALAMQGTHFDITLQENDGDDWSFSSIVMSDCLITSAAPSNATPMGAPTATFSGISLAASMTDKQNNTVDTPAA